MNDEELKARWAGLEKAAQPTYRYYKPLQSAADLVIAEAQDQHRIYTGIPEFDYEMRGIGRGHLCNIVGYSHSGKTLVLLKILLENADKRIAYFAPDETQSLVLTKLAALVSGVSARELEHQISQRDSKAISLLRSVAEDRFPNLAVFDGTLTPTTMTNAYKEVTQEVWHDSCDLVIVDYVDLFEHGETAPQKFNWLKAFGIDEYLPLIAVHQTSRSAGAQGREMDIDSGNFGGEQHATFQLGVRRKESEYRAKLSDERRKANPDPGKINDLERELALHQYTLTVNLVKNKRPGGRRHGEIDFEIEAGTGALKQLEGGDLPAQYRRDLQALKSAAAAQTVDDVTWEEPEIEYEDF